MFTSYRITSRKRPDRQLYWAPIFGGVLAGPFILVFATKDELARQLRGNYEDGPLGVTAVVPQGIKYHPRYTYNDCNEYEDSSPQGLFPANEIKAICEANPDAVVEVIHDCFEEKVAKSIGIVIVAPILAPIYALAFAIKGSGNIWKWNQTRRFLKETEKERNASIQEQEEEDRLKATLDKNSDPPPPPLAYDDDFVPTLDPELKAEFDALAAECAKDDAHAAELEREKAAAAGSKLPPGQKGTKSCPTGGGGEPPPK